MVLIALAIGALAGLALGALASRSPAATRIVRAGGVGMLALPSLAAFALLLALFGTDSPFATIGLTLYATAMFARSTVLALRQVDPAIRDAARSLGLSWPRRLVTVEVPTAWPSLLAGLRIVALTLVPVGAVAAVFDGPGLGRVLLDGIATPDRPHRLAALVAGTVLLLLLAYGLDLILVTVGRLTISGGLRD